MKKLKELNRAERLEYRDIWQLLMEAEPLRQSKEAEWIDAVGHLIALFNGQTRLGKRASKPLTLTEREETLIDEAYEAWAKAGCPRPYTDAEAKIVSTLIEHLRAIRRDNASLHDAACAMWRYGYMTDDQNN